jgi:branched-chain amino acid transport system ATP-binding protein
MPPSDAGPGALVLETRSLTRTFGGLRAVDSVDFKLSRGELRAIIGPNGAGKSTFFAMLMGRVVPTAGEVLLDGERISRMPPHRISRRGVSLAFQITNIFPNLSVADNVRLAVQSRRMSFNPLRGATSRADIEEKVGEILGEIALAGKAEELAANLAHGEQKYLEIGLALATSPKLLLLDEPTAGMSAQETAATAELIKRLSLRLSVVLVEHDMDVVMDIADTITVFHQGRILAEGTPGEIRASDEVQRVYLKGA